MRITHRSDIAWDAFDVKADEYLTLQLTVNERGVVYLHAVNGRDVASIDGVPLPEDDFSNWVRAAGSDALNCQCNGTVDTDCICVPPWEEREVGDEEPLSETTAIFRQEGGRIISGEPGK